MNAVFEGRKSCVDRTDEDNPSYWNSASIRADRQADISALYRILI